MVYDRHGTRQVYESTVRTLAMQCNWLNARNQNFTVFGRFSAVYLGRIGDPDSLNIELWCVFFHGMQSGKAKNQMTPVESRDYQKSNLIHR